MTKKIIQKNLRVCLSLILVFFCGLRIKRNHIRLNNTYENYIILKDSFLEYL